jgi:superfamily II DNA or RNA helicase
MITLREKQAEAMALIRAAFAALCRALLYVAPCAFGKTVLFSAMAESAARRGRRVLILCHRVELVDQIVETLRQFGVIPEIIAAGYQRSAGRERVSTRAVAVASVQTLVRRLDSYTAPTLIIIDEAHHAVASTWSTILRHYHTAKILGVTASPIRADSRGLAAHFDKMIVGPSVTELTEAGLLAPCRLFAPPTVDTSGLHIRGGEFKTEEAEALMDVPRITGDALAHYRKHCAGKPALAFCTSVAHAHHVAERFRKEGVSAVAIDGGTDRQIRRMAVNDFRDGKIQLFSQCQIANEGFDIPGVHCGLLLRPTASLALWIQMTGRCMRIAPGKTHAILMDHTNNASRHGLPSDPRDWQLTSDIIRKKKAAPGIRVCPACFAASPARASACIECKRPFEVKPRQDLEERDGELIELTAEEIAKKRARREQGRSRTLAELEAFAKMKGFAPGWAQHVWAAREAKKQKESA